MKPTTPELIATIATTLETYVLPEFEASDWNASRLRSCLQLLRFLEKRVVLEADIISNINADAEVLLGDIVEFLSAQLPEDTLIDEIRTATLDHLDETTKHERYMGLLDRCIVSLHDTPLSNTEAYTDLKSKIREFLCNSTSKEQEMYAIGNEYTSL